ncbi:MAG: right-handed parallel beta-helix repeat-containing protein, partial [Planctomycetaceae bacterium]|nr:right-handed parallel beta-helix repeat-containing protein [Planctomycetaceae bacterium]
GLVSRLEIIDSELDNNAGFEGGAIWTQVETTVHGTTLRNNVAFLNGGAVFIAFDEAGSVTRIESSTLSGNVTEISDGGAIWVGGQLVAENVTISGNSADFQGGGIYFDFGSPFAELTHVTVTQNTADVGAGVTANNDFSVFVTNSIIAENIGEDLFGELASNEFNLIGGNPLLAELQDNGGSTFTHALLTGSPAINAATDLDVFTDQRGQSRIGAPDIGAFEFAAPAESLFTDFSPGAASSELFVIGQVNGLLVIHVYDGDGEDGFETDPGQYVLRPGQQGALRIGDAHSVFGGVVAGDSLYFVSTVDRDNGEDIETEYSLTRTDGTAEGTETVLTGIEIPPLGLGSFTRFVELNDVLFLLQFDISTGVELYRLEEGGQPELIADVTPGTNVGDPSGTVGPQNITVFNNRIYFAAPETFGEFSNETPYNIYSTSGEVGDIRLEIPLGQDRFRLRDIEAGDDELFVIFNKFIEINVADQQLLRLTPDGVVTRLNLPEDVQMVLQPNAREVYRGDLYFLSTTRDLWVSDGTQHGTRMLRQFSNISGRGVDRFLRQTNDFLYFEVIQPSGTSQIWRTDGTTAGTIPVVNDAASFASPAMFHGLLFNGDTLQVDLESGKITPIFEDLSSVRFLTTFDGQVFVRGNDGVTGHELHSTPFETITADLQVKIDDVNQEFRGDDLQEDSLPVHQNVGLIVGVETTARYNILVENDGDEAQTFFISSTSRRLSDWDIKVFAGGLDVTEEVFGSGFETSLLSANGGEQLLTVEVTAGTPLRNGAVLPLEFAVFDTSSRDVGKDSVRVITSVPRFFASGDLHVGANGIFVGDDLYETAPTEAQTFEQ